MANKIKFMMKKIKIITKRFLILSKFYRFLYLCKPHFSPSRYLAVIFMDLFFCASDNGILWILLINLIALSKKFHVNIAFKIRLLKYFWNFSWDLGVIEELKFQNSYNPNLTKMKLKHYVVSVIKISSDIRYKK